MNTYADIKTVNIAVAQVVDQGRLIADVAAQHGISRKTLYSWVKQSKQGAVDKRRKLEEQIAHLQQRLQVLTRELDALATHGEQ